MNIKDPAVRELAFELAQRRKTSATGAIREALLEALERDRQDRAGISTRLMGLGRRSAALPEPALTDADFYDERGLPR